MRSHSCWRKQTTTDVFVENKGGYKMGATREEAFLNSFDKALVQFEILREKTVLVTGASGLIGRMMVWGLQFLNDREKTQIRILALVRDMEKGKCILLSGRAGKERTDTWLLTGDVTEKLCVEKPVDYIIHAASMTASRCFVEKPVEVAMTNIYGTRNVLELAREKKVASVIYLSSMEVYGFTNEEELLSEDVLKYLDPLAVRSSYPESKKLCETLCAAYVSEYHVPVKIARLAQTFGFGVDSRDNRAFAAFARSAVKGQDIVLQTTGTSKRMYLDSADAVTALLTILLKGVDGRAYNAANKDTYCSIKEMAQFVAEQLGGGTVNVIVRSDLETNSCLQENFYAPMHCLKLDVSEIENLGWKPSVGLKEMFERLLEENEEEWKKGRGISLALGGQLT